MNRAQLQGTPWHNEQMKRSCNYGSTYCLYNKNICTCKGSPNYHHKCIGKGLCEDFESKGNTPKVISSVTYAIKEREKQINKRKKENKTMVVNNVSDDIDDIEENEELSPDETPEEKFKRVSKPRIDKAVNCIRTIANLSNRNIYSYTEEEVDKMFNHLQLALDKAKKSFKQEKFMDEFKWEP